jgi:anthranilate synthase component 2
MMKILLIDNYDSFTYNLLHILRELGAEIDVVRNDAIPFDRLDAYQKIVLSPGPGIPSEAGDLLRLIREAAPSKSILGVCLGEQAIGEAFGAQLTNLSEVHHGVQTPVRTVAHDPLFEGLPEVFPVGRYHSWVVSSEGLPAELEVTAVDDEGEIMALRHRTYDVRGVQFHPESILTPDGKQMLANFLKL